MNSAANDISIAERLREVYEKTDSREYAEALDALELARVSDPGNIYVAALRRQLEALLSLSQADDLSEDRRKELMEPMPGIIECAIRDNQRQHRTGVIDVPVADEQQAAPIHVQEAAPAPDPDVVAADAQRELEALKLLYFQRASKFVMKGEYEQALAEVRRVFVVDPDNTIAKEYASRVEQLIQHARRLAAEPLPSVPAPRESDAPMQPRPAPGAEQDPHVHTDRSTAWDSDFVAPKTQKKIPEHRPAPPSSRQTMAYGDSLAETLDSFKDSSDDESEHKGGGLMRPKVFLILAAVILAPLLAGIAVAIFSAKDAGATGRQNLPVNQTQTLNPAPVAEATIGGGQTPVIEKSIPVVEEHQTPVPPPQVKLSSPPVEQKPKPEPAQVKKEIAQEAPPVEIPTSEPLKAAPPASEAAPPPAKPPVEEAAPVPTPTFVAVQRDPQIIRLEKPEFPSFVWKMGIEGQVVVRVLIDANGKPRDSQILKSTNPVFEQPVVDAVMKSQFNPAQMGQGPVSAWLTIPFKFRQPR